MEYWLIRLPSYTILFAIIASLIRRSRIEVSFYPFILLLWIGLFNEMATEILSKVIRSNAINSNIYVLLEALIITWQFKRWKLFQKPALLHFIGISFLLVWLWECVVFLSINQFLAYYRIYYSFIVVLLSIQMVNVLIINEKGLIIRHPVFLVCISFILFFTLKVLIEIFWLYGLSLNPLLSERIYKISIYVNLFSNLIFALAILWMPKKREFIPQF